MGDRNEGANLLRDAVTRIPIFTGDGNDAFTPAQWLDRIEKARDTAAWNEANTMSFVYISLRGKALKWHESLKRSGIEMTFAAFSIAFLASFAPARTARTATVNLHEVKQQSNEDVVGFYARVIAVIDELELLLPQAVRRPNNAVMHPEIVALAGYNALHADIRGIIPTMVDLGITAAFNHVAIQLFVAGLKPAIRDEMMKNMPVILWDAFQQAITLEKIHMPIKTNLPMVNEIEEQEIDEIDGEIEAVRARLHTLNTKKSSYRPFSSTSKPGSASGSWTNGKSGKSNSNSNTKDTICRVCKKKGHFQNVCYTRIAKGLPCVDANGVPLKTQPPPPPPRSGRVAEIGQQPQGASGHHGGTPPTLETPPPPAMAGYMMPPPSQGGYWTPYPPNFP